MGMLSCISGSACGSVGPEDSVSQFPEPSWNLPPDISAFLKGFAAFLGFRVGSHSVSFHEMVSKEIESRLTPNPVSLSVSSLPSVDVTVKFVANPLPAPAQGRVFNHSRLVTRQGKTGGRISFLWILLPWVIDLGHPRMFHGGSSSHVLWWGEIWLLHVKNLP